MNAFDPKQNAGQRAGLSGRYNFSQPHSSFKSRLRRLKQIAKGQITSDQIDLTIATPQKPPVSLYKAPEFEMTYEDDDAETSNYDHANDRSPVEPRIADEAAEKAEDVSAE